MATARHRRRSHRYRCLLSDRDHNGVPEPILPPQLRPATCCPGKAAYEAATSINCQPDPSSAIHATPFDSRSIQAASTPRTVLIFASPASESHPVIWRQLTSGANAMLKGYKPCDEVLINKFLACNWSQIRLSNRLEISDGVCLLRSAKSTMIHGENHEFKKHPDFELGDKDAGPPQGNSRRSLLATQRLAKLCATILDGGVR